MLLLLSSLDHRDSRHPLMLCGPRETSLSSRDCRLARIEAELNNAECGNSIVPAIPVRIRDHEAFRTAVGPNRLRYRGSHNRYVSRILHNHAPTMPISISERETRLPYPARAAGSTSHACEIAAEYRTQSLVPWRTSFFFLQPQESNWDAKGTFCLGPAFRRKRFRLLEAINVTSR
jgi:hypothetical protein